MQSRTSFSIGEAEGVDDITSEVLKAIPCRAVAKIRGSFGRGYLAHNKGNMDSCLKNVFVLIPKEVGRERLGGQTHGITVQSILATWYCGCFDHFVGHCTA